MLNYLRIKQYVLWCFDFYSVLFGVLTARAISTTLPVFFPHLVVYNLVIHYLFPFFWLILLLVHCRKMGRSEKTTTQKRIFYFYKEARVHFYADYGIVNLRQPKRCQLNMSGWQFDIFIPPIAYLVMR